MTPEIRQTFIDLLASTGETWCEGCNVLEVGATNTEDTLLTIPCLAQAYRYGMNPDRAQAVTREYPGVTILNCWAHNIEPTAPIDLILCNSVLEHDACFWRTITAMRDALRPGGWLVVGAPSFSDRLDAGPERTICMERHDFPADFYRFSPAMFREVIFGGYKEVTILDIMDPPRCVGIGRKPS